MRIRTLVLPRFRGITRRLRSEPMDGEARAVIVPRWGPCKTGVYERFGLRARKARNIPAGRSAAKNKLMNDLFISCKSCHRNRSRPPWRRRLSSPVPHRGHHAAWHRLERSGRPPWCCGARARRSLPSVIGPAIRPGLGFARPYRSSTSAVLLAYAVLLASKKSVFTILALEYWLTQAISSGSERWPS